MKLLLFYFCIGTVIIQFHSNYFKKLPGQEYLSSFNNEGIIKIIDKRTKSDVMGNTYFLVFISKPTVLNGGENAGHSFVVWGIEDRSAKISYGKGWGLYPSDKNAKKMLTLGKVPGVLKDEGMNDGNFNKLIVKVDKEIYDSTVMEMEKWSMEKSYQLLTKDCLSFTIAIASAAKLKIPNREGFDTIPWNYILQLIKNN